MAFAVGARSPRRRDDVARLHRVVALPRRVDADLRAGARRRPRLSTGPRARGAARARGPARARRVGAPSRGLGAWPARRRSGALAVRRLALGALGFTGPPLVGAAVAASATRGPRCRAPRPRPARPPAARRPTGCARARRGRPAARAGRAASRGGAPRRRGSSAPATRSRRRRPPRPGARRRVRGDLARLGGDLVLRVAHSWSGSCGRRGRGPGRREPDDAADHGLAEPDAAPTGERERPGRSAARRPGGRGDGSRRDGGARRCGTGRAARRAGALEQRDARLLGGFGVAEVLDQGLGRGAHGPRTRSALGELRLELRR